MRSAKRLAIGISSAALLTGILSSTTAIAGSGDNPCWRATTAERGFTKKMNGARSNANVNKLSLDPELSQAARKHTREMVNQNKLYHTPSSKLGKRVTNWSVLGENVGVGDGVASLHSAFMGSDSHRDNILYSKFRHVGVGVRKSDGRMWVTVIFEAKTDPGTPLKMPSC